MKTSNLENISDYITEKIELKKLNNKTYISTENMLPNKAGVINATTLPNTKCTSAFKKGDILVSNIRPYFKKIWQATFVGGCSNDVLVFRAKNGINNKFLYYILSDDKFFEYSMSTAKGTKMPRGDKNSLMKYEIPDFDFETQQKIAKVLSAIDDKIELNNSINNNLEQQAQAIFKSWFVDFEPFSGTMPNDWKDETLGVISNITSGKRPIKKSQQNNKEMNIPIIGASSIMGYTNDVLFDEKILVTGRVGTHGIVQKISFPCCPSDNTLVITSPCYEYVYQILKTIDYSKLNRGSTQPLITQSDLKNIKVLLPSRDILSKFESVASSFSNLQNQLREENRQLAQLRDTILPKLLNGEIDVSKVEI